MKYKINVIALLLSILCGGIISCTPKNTYKLRLSRCLEDIETTKFEAFGKNYIQHKDFDFSCLIGSKLPEFELIKLNNEVLKTKDLKGKINVFNFWFKGCPPCIKEIPDLNQLVKKYSSEKVKFMALSLDKEDILLKFLNDTQFNFEHFKNGNDIIVGDFEYHEGYPLTIITNKKNEIKVLIKGDQIDENNSAFNLIDKIISELIDS